MRVLIDVANGRVSEELLETLVRAGLVEWIYAELFEMPLSDPALGLDVPDPFPARAWA